MTTQTSDWLKTLTEQAAASLGPIAGIVVEQAAADGAAPAEVRERVAEQIDAGARERFLRTTEHLVPAARPGTATVAPARPTPAATPAASATLANSDPAFIKALARDLAARIGRQGETMVLEAAHRCRTRMQLCIRIASQVADPALKAYLSKLALDDPRAAGRRKS